MAYFRTREGRGKIGNSKERPVLPLPHRLIDSRRLPASTSTFSENAITPLPLPSRRRTTRQFYRRNRWKFAREHWDSAGMYISWLFEYDVSKQLLFIIFSPLYLVLLRSSSIYFDVSDEENLKDGSIIIINQYIRLRIKMLLEHFNK